MLKAFGALVIEWVMVVTEELKCPWCGTDFEDVKQLEEHARHHYVKELVA
jgi:protein-disulfide isomerase